MKRKLSRLELALLVVPVLALFALMARQPLSVAWNRAFIGGIAYQGDQVFFKFSPDGKQLLISSWNSKTRAGQMQWIDPQTQRVRANVENQGAGFINWSPDGKLFALVGGNAFEIWDSTNHVKLWRAAVPGARYLFCEGWASNSVLKLSTTAMQGKKFYVRTDYQFDAQSKNLRIASTKTSPSNFNSSTRFSNSEVEIPARLSPDGRWKVSISDSVAVKTINSATPWRSTISLGRRVLLWNRATKKLEYTFEGDLFDDVIFVDNNTIVGVARMTSSNGLGYPVNTPPPPMTYVSTMNPKSQQALWQALDSEENSRGFSPDKRFLLTLLPNRLRLRDARTVRIVAEEKLKSPYVSSSEFSPDGRFLAYYCSPTTSKPVDSGNIFLLALPDPPGKKPAS